MSNKTGLALTSLAAAVPAAVLTGLLVYSFLNHAENMTTMFKLLAGFTLLMSFLITVSPAGILLFAPKPEEEESEAGEGPESEPTEAIAEAAEPAEEPAAAEAEPDEEFAEPAEDAEFDADEPAVEAAESDAEVFDESDDELADVDFDDFEDENRSQASP